MRHFAEQSSVPSVTSVSIAVKASRYGLLSYRLSAFCPTSAP